MLPVENCVGTCSFGTASGSLAWGFCYGEARQGTVPTVQRMVVVDLLVTVVAVGPANRLVSQRCQQSLA